MRRFSTCVISIVIAGLAAVLVPASPAWGAPPQTGMWAPAQAAPAQAAPQVGPQIESQTVAVTTVKTVAFDRPADHVTVSWIGNPDARVTLAFSADGTSFGSPVDAGRDDAGEERGNGMTYSAVHATGDAVAVRITTDVPLPEVTVVAMPAGGEVGAPLVATAEPLPFDSLGAGQPYAIPRTSWGADPGHLSWAPRFYPANKVIVHHTADNIVLDGSQEYYAKLVRAIYYYHAVTQDWGDIAYNFLIDPLGNIYEGRYSDDDPASLMGEDIFGNNVVGGHCANYNTATVGIAVLGTYKSQSITAASRASLELLLAWVATRYGIDPLGSDPYFNPYNSASTIQTDNIAGHLDYRPTDCPGAVFHQALPSIRQAVFDLTGPVTAPTPSPTYLILEKSTSSPVAGQQVTLTATLREQSSRTPLPGKTVSFAVAGAAAGESMPLGTAVTDDRGVATLQMTCTTAQALWVSARFDPGPATYVDPLFDPYADPQAQNSYRGATTSSELGVAPSGLVAILGAAEVRLYWDSEPAASGYNVYRNGKKVTSKPVAMSGYVDTGVTDPAACSYQVTAVVNGRESGKSPAVTPSAAAPVSGGGDAPVEDPVGAYVFPDVPPSHPYFTAIEDLAHDGIVNGAPGGLFLPGGSVTRQQFAKMIVLGGDYPVSEEDVCSFKDVTKGGGATLYPDNYVAVCAARGITQGKTATTFDPYGSITRAQVLTMVVRAAKDLKPLAVQEPPADWTGQLSTKDPTHGRNIAWAEYNGLVAGITTATFSVSGAATRGEIAQIIWNLRAK